MSFLGLDVGEKRIGVAFSDELLLLAYAGGLIVRRNNAYTLEEIKRISEEHRIKEIIVGLPKTTKGEIGAKAQEILKFVDWLSKRIKIPVKTWDERFTTVQAEKRLLEHDVSRAKRKEKRDALAAEIMLQAYLDFLRSSSKKLFC